VLFLWSVEQQTDSYTLYSKPNPGPAKFQALIHPVFTAETRKRLQTNLCRFGGRQFDPGTRFYPSA